MLGTLSADNRAAALKEGSKSAEEAALLDSESTYNSEGTQLQETLGPQHSVQLPGGSEVQARQIVHYYYEENAPAEGGPYNLVTKVTEAALTSGKEEDKRTSTDSYGGQTNLGWKLRKPTSVTTDPSGLKLIADTIYEASTGNIIESKMPASSSKDSSVPLAWSSTFGSEGKGKGQFEVASGDATDSSGNVWVVDNELDRIQEFNEKGEFKSEFGTKGSGEVQFNAPFGIAINQTNGDIYITDENNYRVEELSPTGAYIRSFGSKGTGNGQFESIAGIAVGASGEVFVVDNKNDNVQEFSAEGKYEKQFGKKGKENGQFTEPVGITYDNGYLYVTDSGDDRVEEFSTAGVYQTQFGSEGAGNGQFKAPYAIATDPASGGIYVTDLGNDRVQKFTAAGAFLSKLGSEGSGKEQMSLPAGIATSKAGAVYVSDLGNARVDKWIPAVTGNPGAWVAKTIYYSSAANSEYSACGEHPEWAGLPCVTKPAAQPETSGLPELPVTKIAAYNMLDQAEIIIVTSGTSTRTTTKTFDGAGRPSTQETTSTTGTSLPKTTYEYNGETGALEKQSTTTESKTKTITNIENRLGQLISYTDADGNTSTYEYEKEKDARLVKVNDGKGTQTYSYNEITGLLDELVDSSAEKMKFTASYDPEGNLLTEGYPNGMTATYTRNQIGQATGLVYEKTTHCTSSCTMFSDTVVPSIHNQWLSQTSSLSKEIYAYDAASRLTEVQETPIGKSCTTRLYSYEEDTSRTTLTTHEPSSKGECSTTTSATIENHLYDTADRLTDPGAAYNPFGDITALPATDAGGYELTSSFYVDGQLATQTQNGETNGYNLDPTGRTREIVSTGKTTQDIINHYSAGGAAPAWTVETTSGSWTRDIHGIDGGLAAIQVNGATPVLQLADLHGDIIATAALNETETKLLSNTNTTEFGVPTTTTPAKYSWLGAEQQPTELPSGAISMGARSYIPQLGRFLQPDPIPGGSANAYTYTYGDPINTSDPTGAYTYTASYVNQFDEEWANEAPAREAARLAAARAEAERRAQEAAQRAAAEATLQAEVEATEAQRDAPYPNEEEAEEAEGEGGGLSHFVRAHGDPGLPPGAQCEGADDSKKYKKEHKKLCHEIESRPWEPLEAWCWLVPNPICNDVEKVQKAESH